jgi:hypothetical protein
MQNFFTVALPLLASVTTNMATLPSSVSTSTIQEFVPEKTAILEVAPERPKEKRLICKGCNENENAAMAYFQSIGITDKNALATIMGNIKQESMFVPNICEGGYRTAYHNCGRGYGLIQFTSSDRYYGLGSFSRKIGGNPSTLDTQLQYIVSEPQWKQIENRMRVPGKSIDHYMNYAYNWIGWGIHGARTSYAYDYANRMITIEV